MKREFKYFPGIDIVAKFTPLTSKSKLVVVFVPGYFSASSIGPNRIFIDIEEALVDKCSFSYRLDWPGMGDNQGCLSDYSFSELVDQLANFCKFIQLEHKLVNVCFIAHSMGCALLEHALGQIKLKANRVIFLSPVSTNELAYKSLLGNVEILDGHFVRKGVKINKDFIKNPCGKTVYENAGRNTNEIVTISCEDDPFTSIGDLSLITRNSMPSTKYVIPIECNQN